MFKKRYIFFSVHHGHVASAPNSGASSTELGVMTCRSIPRLGKENLLIPSRVRVLIACIVRPRLVSKKSQGEAGIALGLDLSWTKESTIAYTVMVVGLGRNLQPGELVGTYTGGNRLGGIWPRYRRQGAGGRRKIECCPQSPGLGGKQGIRSLRRDRRLHVGEKISFPSPRSQL